MTRGKGVGKGLSKATRSAGKTGGKGVNSGRGRKAAKKAAGKRTLRTTTKPVQTLSTARGNAARNTLAATRKRVNVNNLGIRNTNPLN